MRALVTGAAGFIGAGVARALRDDGAELLLLDRAPADPSLGSSRRGDVGAVASLLNGETVDAVVHAAGITTAACERDPEAAFRVNVEGTRALIAWCGRLPRPPRFVLTSSVAVFGRGDAVVDEATLPGPRSTYGATKLMAEALVLDATRRGQIAGVVVRLPVTIVRTGRDGRPGAGYLSDLILRLARSRDGRPTAPFVAPLRPDHAVPVAEATATFAGLARLATSEGPGGVLHVPSATGTGAAVLAAARRFVQDAEAGVAIRPDPAIEALVAGWPERLASRRTGPFPVPGPDWLDALVARHLGAVAPA